MRLRDIYLVLRKNGYGDRWDEALVSEFGEQGQICVTAKIDMSQRVKTSATISGKTTISSRIGNRVTAAFQRIYYVVINAYKCVNTTIICTVMYITSQI